MKGIGQRPRSHDTTYVESHIWHKWTYLQNRNRLTDTENRLVVVKGEAGWGRDGQGVWD